MGLMGRVRERKKELFFIEYLNLSVCKSLIYIGVTVRYKNQGVAQNPALAQNPPLKDGIHKRNYKLSANLSPRANLR